MDRAGPSPGAHGLPSNSRHTKCVHGLTPCLWLIERLESQEEVHW